MFDVEIFIDFYVELDLEWVEGLFCDLVVMVDVLYVEFVGCYCNFFVCFGVVEIGFESLLDYEYVEVEEVEDWLGVFY